MSEDVTFCGVFDGHGPHGHLVACKVREALPLKLLSFLHSSESGQNGSGKACFRGNIKPESGESEKDLSAEDNENSMWREAFMKAYKAMDKELRSHPNLDCFCSGSTAVTIVKQVSQRSIYPHVSISFKHCFYVLYFPGFKFVHGKYWGFPSNHGIKGQQPLHGGNSVDH